MIVGILKEIKDGETRVALLPAEVKRLTSQNLEVWVERGAGSKIGITDFTYRQAGAKTAASAERIWRHADLVVKVKEPLPSEFHFFHPQLKLFCFLHLAANPKLIQALQKYKVTAFGYETLQEEGVYGFPLLKPMSEIAGRLSIMLGAEYLRSDFGGHGVLLSPTSSSDSALVTVIGAGNVGRSAAELAWSMGASVQVFDQNESVLQRLRNEFPGMDLQKPLNSLLVQSLKESDLVIGAIYLPGAKTPQIIRREMVQKMKAGSVLVDVAIDQGGAAETSHPTSISKPTYRKYGVVHSAIPNLPALAGRTASESLSRVLWSYVGPLVKNKLEKIREDFSLNSALQVSGGQLLLSGIG